MTKEQLAELAAGPPTPMGLERLLEERKRLMDALRPILERIDGDREFVCPDGGAEMILAAHWAIAFAEEDAPG